DPRLLWNVAVCEKQLRHYAKTIPLLEKFLELAAPLITAEERRTATEFSAALRKLVGEVTLECSQSDALLFIDEERIADACQKPFLLDAGDHHVRANKTGYK